MGGPRLTETPISRRFVSQRLRLHFVDWGNEAAPPLVLVHGGQDHCRAWDWVARRLAADWHVIVPDLRGHGDSQWADAGGYTMAGFIHDLAQLIDQQGLAPVTVIGHSLGGSIATRHAGVFPETVTRLVSIEGLGRSPKQEQALARQPIEERMRDWVAEQRRLAGRAPRRYASLDEALDRMQGENKHLSAEQALHLTRHGVRQNEDGTYSWKFDNHVRAMPPYDMTGDEIRRLWSRIACPTLLIHGADSWASNPATDGRAAHFQDATVVSIEGAGHWVHHDRLDAFMAVVLPFLAGAG